MKIKEILKKQGELYKDLTSSETIQEYSKIIKPVLYKNHPILKREYEAIIGLEKVLGKEPIIVNKPTYGSKSNNFEMSIKGNMVVYLRIINQNLKEIPEQINNLTGLEKLWLYRNQISEIKNLDNLQNLKSLWLSDNKIKEIKGLSKLQNLQKLYLDNNQILRIMGVDKLTSLKELGIRDNPIKNKKEAEILRESMEYVGI